MPDTPLPDTPLPNTPLPDTPSPEIGAERTPVSPCLGICLMDPKTRICRGCLRTIEEIACWYTASNAEKRAILERLDKRRAASREGGRR